MSENNVEMLEEVIHSDMDDQNDNREIKYLNILQAEVNFQDDPEAQVTEKNDRMDMSKQEEKLQKRERKKTQHYVADFPDLLKRRTKIKSSLKQANISEPQKVKKKQIDSNIHMYPEIIDTNIPLERDEELITWQIQLQSLSNLLVTLLSSGLPMLTLKNDSSNLEQLVQELHENLAQTNPQPSKIIQKLIAPLIENSSYFKSDHEITKDCLEYIKDIAKITIWPEEIMSMFTLQELVVSMKEKKNYLPKTIELVENIEPNFSFRRILQQSGSIIAEDQQFDDLEAQSTNWQVQEILDQNMLFNSTTSQEIQNNRRVRKYLRRLIESLHKLINVIHKSTKKEQIIKIEEAFKQYVDVKTEKVKLIKDKIKKQLKEKKEIKVKEAKEPKQPKQIEEHSKIKALHEKFQKKSKIQVQPDNTQKQLKITDMKVNFANPQILKDQAINQTNNDNKLQQHEPMIVEQQVSPKPNMMKEETPKKSQFSILNFFNTKDKKQGLPSKQLFKIEIFKSLGAKLIGSQWQEQQEQEFELMLHHLQGDQQNIAQITLVEQQFPIKKYIVEKCMDTVQQKQIVRERKVHIYIFDSKKILRGIKYNKLNSLISGKQPLKKDESNVDYDIDSEDEMQELYAENIVNSQKDDEEEVDQVSESDEKFVVSDGHLSMEEFSDKEDYKQRAQDLVENEGQNLPGQDLALKSFSYFAHDQTHQQLFSEYQMIKIFDLEFPIMTKKQDESKSSKFFDSDENMINFLTLISGSFLSMQKISQRYKQSNPTCSKYCAERKLKEISEKKRGEIHIKERWIIRQDILNKYGITVEQNLKIMLENEQEFLQNKKQKSDKKKQYEIEAQNLEKERMVKYLKSEEFKTNRPKKISTPSKLPDDHNKEIQQEKIQQIDEVIIIDQE